MVTLVDTELGDTKVFVEVHISPETGDFIMAGQDLGGAPMRAFGDDEYEYFLSVAAADKDKVLLYLMQHVFAGVTKTRTAIAEWLDARKIAYGLHSF